MTVTNKAVLPITKIYGEMPSKPIHLDHRIKSMDPSFAAGKATLSEIELITDLGEKSCIIPITTVIPNEYENPPAIIFLSYEREIPNRFLPAEEITDKGYAIFSLCIKDVSGNDGNFKSGISAHIARSRRKKTAPGKISVWAWAALRALEYVHSLDTINRDAIILAAHGILARAALLTCGYSGKANYVIANGLTSYPIPYSDGSVSSAISLNDNPHLYCPAYAEFPFGNELSDLLSICDGKQILISEAENGASEDSLNDIIPTADGGKSDNLSYHTRPGYDYLCREDWSFYLDLIDDTIDSKSKV